MNFVINRSPNFHRRSSLRTRHRRTAMSTNATPSWGDIDDDDMDFPPIPGLTPAFDTGSGNGPSSTASRPPPVASKPSPAPAAARPAAWTSPAASAPQRQQQSQQRPSSASSTPSSAGSGRQPYRAPTPTAPVASASPSPSHDSRYDTSGGQVRRRKFAFPAFSNILVFEPRCRVPLSRPPSLSVVARQV